MAYHLHAWTQTAMLESRLAANLHHLRNVIAQGNASAPGSLTRTCAGYMARVLGRDAVRIVRTYSNPT